MKAYDESHPPLMSRVVIAGKVNRRKDRSIEQVAPARVELPALCASPAGAALLAVALVGSSPQDAPSGVEVKRGAVASATNVDH